MLKSLSTHMGTYLFALRGRATIEQFTAHSGISRATWSRVERGYAPTIRTLMKIHDVFGCPWDELMTHYRQDFLQDEEEVCQGAACFTPFQHVPEHSPFCPAFVPPESMPRPKDRRRKTDGAS